MQEQRGRVDRRGRFAERHLHHFGLGHPRHPARHPAGQRGELAGVGHVELEHRGRLGQPPGDPLHQAEPPEPGEHQGGPFTLRDARHGGIVVAVHAR